MELNYRGVPVNYSSTGYGRPIVLLHGFLETVKIWDPFLEGLSATRQVICINLPGHGSTGNFGEIHTMELMADVVYTVLQHLNISKATLLGHSMGGYVSLAFAEKYPDIITGLVLMNSTPEADSEDRKLVRDRAVKLVIKNKKAYINMAISNLVGTQNSLTYKDEILQLKKEALKISKEGIIANLKGMKIRTNKIEVLKQLTTPKIMILATDDPILPYKNAENIAILCKCKVKSVNGGHLSYLENYNKIFEMMYFID